MKDLKEMSNEELLKEIREKSRQAASGFLQPHIDKIEAEILKRMNHPNKIKCICKFEEKYFTPKTKDNESTKV